MTKSKQIKSNNKPTYSLRPGVKPPSGFTTLGRTSRDILKKPKK